MSAAGGAAAAAAAAAAMAKMREEEEELTQYKPEDLNGWEFKIVRSSVKIAGDKFRLLCEEEARNGWELVEKFDNSRVRFKRRIQCREQDTHTDLDPYRTQYGPSEAKIVFIVLGVIFAVLALIATLVIMYGSSLN